MATGYGDATRELVQQLNDAGLEATADPRNLSLPGLWLQGKAINHDRLDNGAYTATWSIYAVVPDNGPTESLDSLSELAAELLDVLPDLGEGTIVGVQLPNHSPDPLPALQFTIELEVS